MTPATGYSITGGDRIFELVFSVVVSYLTGLMTEDELQIYLGIAVGFGRVGVLQEGHFRTQ